MSTKSIILKSYKMIDLIELKNYISDNEDSYKSITDIYNEFINVESSGIVRTLEYLTNSHLILWKEFFDNPETKSVIARINEAIDFNESSPSLKNIFKSYEYCDPKNIRAIFIGMDPYPQVRYGCKVSTGIPFEINPEIYEKCIENGIGVSYINFIKELKRDIFRGRDFDVDKFDFRKLISQGIFFINYGHTVKSGNASTKGITGSHLNIWSEYVEILISYIISKNSNIFIAVLGLGISSRLNDFSFMLGDRYMAVSHPSRHKDGRSKFYKSGIFSKIEKHIGDVKWI